MCCCFVFYAGHHLTYVSMQFDPRRSLHCFSSMMQALSWLSWTDCAVGLDFLSLSTAFSSSLLWQPLQILVRWLVAAAFIRHFRLEARFKSSPSQDWHCFKLAIGAICSTKLASKTVWIRNFQPVSYQALLFSRLRCFLNGRMFLDFLG